MTGPELTSEEIRALTIHELPIDGVLVGSVGAKTAVFRITEEREDGCRAELVAVLDYSPIVYAEMKRGIKAVIGRDGMKPTRFVHERDADGRTVATIPKFDASDL